MTAVAGWIGKKTAGLVFQGIIGFDAVGFILPNDMRGVFGLQTFQFDAGGIGVWVENAYYVGDVFV
jgi:hypothetical protein